MQHITYRKAAQALLQLLSLDSTELWHMNVHPLPMTLVTQRLDLAAGNHLLQRWLSSRKERRWIRPLTLIPNP